MPFESSALLLIFCLVVYPLLRVGIEAMFAELSIAPFNSVCSASCILELFFGAYLQSVSLTELRAP